MRSLSTVTTSGAGCGRSGHSRPDRQQRRIGPIDLLRSLFLSWAANAITLLVVIAVLDKVTIGGVGALLGAALLFGLLNTLVKPVLKLITLPLAIVTLRLIWFGVSMLMLLITAWIVDSFDIDGFWALVWATLIVWVVNLLLDLVPGPWRHTRRD
jgi:putative membrane protein